MCVGTRVRLPFGLSLAEVAVPHVEDLGSTIHESSSIGVLDGDTNVSVVRVPTERIMTIAISVGTRVPANCTSVSRVLLTNQYEGDVEHYLADVRFEPRTKRTAWHTNQFRANLVDVCATGYVLINQELKNGLRSAPVPIHDASGHEFAAMNVSVNSNLITIQELSIEILPQLRQAANRVEEDFQ